MAWKLHGFEITPELAYLIEALKVEGYWTTEHRRGEIQNKNLALLFYIEDLLKRVGVNTKKSLLIKIKPKWQNFKSEDIQIIDKQGKQLRFHIEHSPFDGSKKIKFYLPFKARSFIFKQINKATKISFRIRNCKIFTYSAVPIFIYTSLTFYKKDFLELLDFLIPIRGAHNMRLHKNLYKLQKEYVSAAFSALVDCEGSIEHYGLKRQIRIRMVNKAYLEDWRDLLSAYKIDSRVERAEELKGLVISGYEDFDKLVRLGVNFRHSEKSKKWGNILSTYKKKQVSRNSALDFYSSKIRERGPISKMELATLTGKSHRVTSHFLTKLKRQNRIKVIEGRVPKYIWLR